MRRLFVLILLLGTVALTACGNPFTDDGANGATPTPVATEGIVPDQSDAITPTPEQAAEQIEDGWRILEAPERVSPGEELSDDQILRMTGPTDAPSTIDPALVRDTSAAFLARHVFRGLVMLNGELDPVPDLAQRIEISDDGMTYRFILHEDLTFHDGTALTAESIKRSLERAADPDLVDGDGEQLPARNYLDDIQGARERMDGERDDIPGIIVVDDGTLEIELVRGVVDFLERMANPSTLIVDVDDADRGDEWSRSPNGSGPFRVAEWDDERQIVFHPHDGYVVTPPLEEIVIRVGPEAAGEMQLYETGQIDLANVPLSALDRIDYEGSPITGELRSEQLLSITMILMNPNHTVVEDENLRRALLHAFPRTEVADVMIDGRVRVADGIVPPEMNDFLERTYPFEFDADGAAGLLPEDVDQLTIYSSGGGVAPAMKHFYEGHLGMDVEVVQLRWADYMSDLEARELPIFVLSWVADGPDAESYLRALFHSESPDNYADFADERVDELLDAAGVEQDEEQRGEMLAEAEQIILESAVIMPLYHGVDYVLVAEHVHGLETTPMGILGLESVWIE